ncbi:MAG: hypothetical protein J6W11_01790 [Alphaproteobacteria bacterium]|nr:hypothetical protein [Alphaproteobacteria bacterium]
MQKLRNAFFKFLNILDRVSYCLLLFMAFGIILDFDFFSINADNYDNGIKIAYKFMRYYSLLLATLILLFLLKTKYCKVVYIESGVWIVLCLFIPYMLHQLPSIIQMYKDNKFVYIEWLLYANLLLLLVISMSNIRKGKVCLFLLGVLGLSHIYFIPEYEEITALQSCAEGKCEQAVKMEIVKIDNGNIIYISKRDNSTYLKEEYEQK